MSMKLNVGTLDRSVRIFLGLALLGFTITQQIGPWGYIGILPLVTGILGRCPAYSVFRISTRPHR